MNSQRDETSRFKSATAQARRNFELARRQFGGSKAGAAVDRAKGFVGGTRRWSAKHLPGGERTLWIGGGIVLVGLIALLFWPKHESVIRAANEPQPVGVALAAKGDVDITLNGLLGTVTPLSTVTVTPQVGGRVVRIDFQEGQLVKAGDVLAEIDPRSFQAALDEAKGALARDTASLENARIELKRQKALFAANATSQQDLAAAEATAKQDAGTVMADQAAVKTAAINLDYTRVVSPISGRVGLRGVDVGNFVSAGQSTGIAVVTQMNPMSVLFPVPEDAISDIIARMNAGIELKADAYNRGQTEKIAAGKLDAVDSQISTSTGTVKMRALFDNESGTLFPNQFVNIRLLVNTLHGQNVIPASAVQHGSQGTFVFVVKPDHTVQMRTVTLGRQEGERIAIAKGLNPGEMVVTDGGDRLSDGDEVTIPSGQKVDAKAVPAASESSAAVKPNSQAARRALFRKLTPDEREKMRNMTPAERKAWLESHRAELMKRKNQPGGGGFGRPPGGGPPH